jgi:hypothetical protein
VEADEVLFNAMSLWFNHGKYAGETWCVAVTMGKQWWIEP